MKKLFAFLIMFMGFALMSKGQVSSTVNFHSDTICVGDTISLDSLDYQIGSTINNDTVMHYTVYYGSDSIIDNNKILANIAGSWNFDSIVYHLSSGNDTMFLINNTVIVNPIPDVTITVIDALCFYDSTGIVTVKSNSIQSTNYETYIWRSTPGGVHDMYYANNLYYQDSLVFYNHNVGFDTLDVSIPGTGCKKTILIEITRPDTIKIGSIVSAPQTICDPHGNGMIDFSILGGTGQYNVIHEILDDTLQTNFNYHIENLSATIHPFKILDDNGCFIDTTITVQSNLVRVDSIKTTNNICFGDTIGTITVFPIGGNAPYTVYCNNDSIITSDSAKFVSLPAGTYVVYVTDTNGCTTEHDTVIITENPRWLPEILSYDSLNVSCSGDLGWISVRVDGAVQYSWDGSAFQGGFTDTTGIRLDSVDLGQHNLYVKDINGCNADTVFSFSITQDTVPVIHATVDHDTICAGETVTLTATGGDSCIWYCGATSIGTGNSISLQIDTTSTIWVEGFGNGCSDFDTVSIFVNPLPILSQDPNYYVCEGNIPDDLIILDGTFTNFDTALLNIDTLHIDVTNDSINILVEVTDHFGCSKTETASIRIEHVIIPSGFSYDYFTICESEINNVQNIIDSNIINYTNISYNTSYDTTISAFDVQYTINSNYGCSTQANQRIYVRSNLTIDSVIISEPLCYGENNGTISVFTNRNTVNYEWSDDSTQSTSYRDNLIAGTYSVTVTDNDNVCSVNDTIQLVEPSELQTCSYIEKEYDCTPAIVSISATGGTQPYSLLNYDNIQWRDSLDNTYCVIDDLNVGAYTFTVSDANGCSKTETITIIDNNLVTTISNTNNASCYGFTDGSITVDVNMGTAPYSITCDSVSVSGDSLTFSGLAAGMHIITVTDSLGCQTVDTVTLTQPNAITISSFAITNEYCGMLGGINVTAIGGTGDLSYHWDNNAVGQIVSNLQGDSTYNVTIRDENSCSISIGYYVGIDSMPTLYFDMINAPLCYGDSNGTAYVTLVGSCSNQNVIWDNSVTTPFNNMLTSGTHYVTVRDCRECPITDSVTIPSVDPIEIYLSGNNANCHSDGSIQIDSVTGGTPSYTYLWSDNSTSISISSPTVNSTYTVTVSDHNGCTATEYSSINFESAPQISVVTTPVDCYGDTNGSAQAHIVGGTGQLYYVWDTQPMDTNSMINGLSARTYMVVVIDENNCRDTATFTITQPDELRVVYTVSNVNCDATVLGSIQIDTIDGGTATYQHFLNGIDEHSNYLMNNLSTGSYLLEIVDAHNCRIQNTIQIWQNPTPTVNAYTIHNVDCYGAHTGSAFVVTNASNPTFLWDNGEQQDTAIALNAGNHDVYVSDDLGCTVSASVQISEPQALNSNTTTFITNCDNGHATTSVIGGIAPYTYDWGNGNTTNHISNLTLGALYTVTITDANGCTKIDSVTVYLPQNNLSVNITTDNNILCNGGFATVSAAATGGSGFYTSYVWDNQSTSMQTMLQAGNHSVTVTDDNGCTATASIVITEPDALSIDQAIITNANCNTPTGSICIQVNGGTLPYTYVWDSYPYNNCCPNGLNPGTHNVTITDANGCTTTGQYSIIMNSAPVASITASTTQVCEGDMVNLSAQGGTFFQWNTGNTSQSISQVLTQSMTFSVIVIDENGCRDTASISINVNPQPNISFNLLDDICYDGNVIDLSQYCAPNYGVIFDGVGVSGNYFYPVNAVGGNFPITATYTDANGCSVSATEFIYVHPMPNATWNTEFPNMCINSNPIQLTGGIPVGGTYSGDGVTNGYFDPAQAGTGLKHIYYTYIDQYGCDIVISKTITVTGIQNIVWYPESDYYQCGNPYILTVYPDGGNMKVDGYNIGHYNGNPGLFILHPEDFSIGVHTLSYELNNGCAANASVPIYIHACDNTNGISDEESSSISLFPNPTKSNITISWEGYSVQKIELFNTIGKKISEQNTIGNSVVVDLSELPNAIYFVRLVTQDGGFTTHKVIKE